MINNIIIKITIVIETVGMVIISTFNTDGIFLPASISIK